MSAFYYDYSLQRSFYKKTVLLTFFALYIPVRFSVLKNGLYLLVAPPPLNKIQRISLCLMFPCPRVYLSPGSISALGFLWLTNTSPPT